MAVVDQTQAGGTAKVGPDQPTGPIDQPAAKVARRLEQEAKGHMTLANQHRQRARTLYRELEEFVAECNARGIDVEVQLSSRSTRSPIPEGGTSDDDGHTTAGD